MPFKGDDLDNAVIDANIEHLANATMQITPKGSTHPSTATACLEGMYRLEEYESFGSLPTFLFKTGVIRDPITQLELIPKKGDLTTVAKKWSKNGLDIVSIDYTVLEAENQSADLTRLVLEPTRV